jgi:hypothetical protein
VYGTRPVEPAAGMRTLASLQHQVMSASRFGIPAVAHEECLTGFAAFRATIFPAPLCWGASFDPDLVAEMAAAIGASMRAAGVHQGLAPVLDVTRDPRWGRTEETIGEDPYLVGMIGTGYVRGLQSSGVHATLKHFAGYSASRAGRNMAPVAMGRRELADVILPPFEMAIRLGGARTVMPSYTDLDGVPAHADPELLGLLRGQLALVQVDVRLPEARQVEQVLCAATAGLAEPRAQLGGLGHRDAPVVHGEHGFRPLDLGGDLVDYGCFLILVHDSACTGLTGCRWSGAEEVGSSSG